MTDKKHTPNKISVVVEPLLRMQPTPNVATLQTHDTLLAILTDANEAANARYFAASWNACHDAGLTAEALESGALQRQQQAILAALTVIDDRLADLRYNGHNDEANELRPTRDFVRSVFDEFQGGAS